jgi:hypothetical protein
MPKGISAELSDRLESLQPDQTLRAVLLLETGSSGRSRDRRMSIEERGALIAEIREAASAALGDVDRILDRFGGRRLSKEPDNLGSITVEASAKGLRALAESERVKVVLEDQLLVYPRLASAG